MFFYLVILFTTIPVLELYVLFKISHYIGFWDTIAIVLITGILGAWLAKSQGFAIVQKIRFELQQGKIPSNSLVEGALILAGGIFLLTPGILTDIAGLLLIFPITRTIISRILKEQINKRISINSIRYYDDTN